MQKNKFKDQVIQYFQKYYAKRKKVPSSRNLFKSFNKTKFYEVFPQGLAQACKAAGIPVPEERLTQTRKARQTAKKKRLGETEKEVTLIQDVKQSYEIQHEVQQREEQRRKEFAEKHAKEDALLLQDPNEAISGPIRDAIENYALPVLLETKYGIKATVPEILAMLKEYKKAEDEGWYVGYVMEWGILSEEGRETFGEICNMNPGGTIGLPDYLSTLKDEIGALISQKKRLLEEVNEIEQKKRKLDWDYSGLKTRYDNLKKNYEEREKRLDNKYYELAKDYGYRFGVVKRQLQDEIGKLIEERDRLKIRNQELRDMSKPTKRLNSKPSHGKIDFTKMREALGLTRFEQKKKIVA